MRARGVGILYHFLARAWLTAAGLSLLLPAKVRLGWWLPLHLAMAGAVSTAISGAMQTFTAGLTAAPDPPRKLVAPQFVLITTGAAMVAAGMTARARWVLAVGGALFALAIVLLAVIVVGHWRRGLNRRFRIVFAFYGAALASVLAGVVIGALLGAGVVTGDAWLGLRDTHIVVNVLGWATLTITGTLITFLPTVLRVRIPSWRAGPTATLLLAGVGTLALGQALDLTPLSAAGAVALLAGTIGIGTLAVGTVRTPRRHLTAVSAKHLLMALLWLLGGTAALAGHMVRAAFAGEPGSLSIAGVHDTFIVAIVGGVILQTLLGAWLYLLPAQRVGGPAERKLLLAGVEHLATIQVGLVNVGLALVAIRPLGIHAWIADTGAWLALAGGTLALAKAWGYGVVARWGITARRAERIWRARDRAGG